MGGIVSRGVPSQVPAAAYRGPGQIQRRLDVSTYTNRLSTPVGRAVRGQINPSLPQNRFIQQRTMPIAGGPGMQPTNPNITNPNVSIGVPMQPPSFVTPPPSDSLNAQVITPITNPVTGETYMAPSGGYTLNPNITNPNVTIGMPITGRTPQLEAMPYTGQTSFGDLMSQAGNIPGYLGQQAIAQNPNNPDAQTVGNLMSGMGSIAAPVLGFMGENISRALAPYQPGYQPTQATNQNPNVSIGFGKSQPGFMQPGPGMGQASQTGPMTGGFNPSLGNTALPGNF